MEGNKIGNSGRLRCLQSYELMDSLPECIYDDITRLAAAICNTPVSLISLLDDKRLFFKSMHGISFNEVHLEDSFCQYIIHDNTELLIVEDATKDERFAKNMMVQNDPHISFYAGISLISPEGHRLGALCVIDTQPKTLTDIQINGLKTLAQQVVKLFELNKTQKELEKKNEELEKILDTSLDVICTIDEEGYFLTVSQASKRIWGYAPNELIGKKYIDFVHDGDRVATEKSEEFVISGNNDNNFENRYIHKNGHLVHMLWSAKGDDNQGIAYCIAKDITERKKAALLLKESEMRFKTLVQEGSDLITILDQEANYIYVSPSSTNVLQIFPEEFIATNAFDYIHPEDKASVLEQFEEIFNSTQVTIKPFRFRDKNNNWRWVETIASNQLNEPSIQGIVANSRDVTDRILYLKAIEEQNARLRDIA